MAEMNDEELSRTVALACGWEMTLGGWKHSIFLPQFHDETFGSVLPFAVSLDACFGPGGPVEYAKAKGWHWALYAYGPNQQASFNTKPGGSQVGTYQQIDPIPARALCLAFLAAIEATK